MVRRVLKENSPDHPTRVTQYKQLNVMEVIHKQTTLYHENQLQIYNNMRTHKIWLTSLSTKHAC